MASSFFEITQPFSSGIVFYGPDGTVDAAAQLSSESSLTVAFKKTSVASANLSSSTSVNTVARRIVHASATLSAGTVTLTVASERHDSLVTISGQTNLVVNLTKISKASTTVSGSSTIVSASTKISKAIIGITAESSVVASIIKISKAISNISGTASVTTSAERIANAKAVLSASIIVFAPKAKIFLATIRINLSDRAGFGSLNAKAIRFSSTLTPDSSLIRSLLLLDGNPLTNQSRTLSVSVAPIFIENTNLLGDTERYYKNSAAGGKRTYSLNWSYIPNFREKTVDTRESRNFIKDIAMDADIHTLTILKQDEAGLTPYTEENLEVFVTGFNENLIRRDLLDNVYYFSCSMTLEEV